LKNGKVTLSKLAGLKPGVHAIHIHEKSDCSAADGSSGGHWNPTLRNTENGVLANIIKEI
jgi:Cu-Zn family superoxide dismutase